MITLVERNGKLALGRVTLSDAGLLQEAACQSLSKWAQWRDMQIDRALDTLPWFDLWNAQDGEYVFPFHGGDFVVAKKGDNASITCILDSGSHSYDERWRKGEPCPIAWTSQIMAVAWDRAVDEKHLMEVLADLVRAYRGSRPGMPSVAPFLLAIAHCDWKDALELARKSPEVYPVDYLTMLVEG